MKFKRLFLILALLGLLSAIGFMVYSKKYAVLKSDNKPISADIKSEEIKADLDGDGNQETLRLSLTNSESKPPEVISLVAFDKSGNELAKLPETLYIPVPMSSGKVHHPDAASKVEFISFDFLLGPHSSETMFLALRNNEKIILPVCLTDEVNKLEDCLFWSGEIDELIVKDIDKDGILEVVEMADEYPNDGTLSKEEEEAITKEWGDMEEEDVASFRRVAIRENGGSGRKVVWGIYKFNGSWFEEQSGLEYDRYFPLVSQHLKNSFADYPEIIKKDKLSRESLDFNLFMRKFWSRR